MDLLNPYVKNWLIYKCPSDGDAKSGVPASVSAERVAYSYGANFYFSKMFNPNTGLFQEPASSKGAVALAEVVKPAEKVWVADSVAFYQGAIPYPWLYSSAIKARHVNGFVIAFADGHEKWLSRYSKYGTTRD